MMHLWWGLLGAAAGTLRKEDRRQEQPNEDGISLKRLLLAFAISATQGVVLFGMLCPVAILYIFGIYIAAGASLWRLITHDFGNDGGANMKPALQLLYSLAVAQGALFGYKTVHAFAAKTGLVKFVHYKLSKAVDEELIEEYLEKTVAGCEQDPSFAKGRNLVTYGMELMMEAKSHLDFVAGITVMGDSIKNGDRGRLVKYLLTGSDSSNAIIIQRLLATVDRRGPCLYGRGIKENVLTIVEIIVPNIRLEQFPRAIECLCSAGDGTEEDNMWGFDPLVIEAVNMIYKLVADEDNRWTIRTCVSNTVLHKIAMLPTELHRENHGPRLIRSSRHPTEWHEMLQQCWVTTEWLLVALTQTSSPAATPVGEQGRQRSSSEEIIEEEQLLVLRSMVGSALESTIKRTIKDSIESTIKCIFDCLDCSATDKKQGIQILLHLSSDMSTIVKDGGSSKRRLIWVLLLIWFAEFNCSDFYMVPSLTYPNIKYFDFRSIKRLAGEKLSEMLRENHGQLPSEESAGEPQSIYLALEDLKNAFYDQSEDITIRTHAIIIMEDLCPIDPLDSEVKEFLVRAIPEVVKETLDLCASKTAEKEGQATDVEKGNVSPDNQDGRIDTQRLRKALASLCHFGYLDAYYSLKSKFEEIASKTCMEQGKSFVDFKRLLRQSLSIEE